MYSAITYNIIRTLSFMATFISLDRSILVIQQCPYYLVHSMHNALIVYYTYPDVINTYMRFNTIHTFPTNMNAICLCFALHFYHCILYWKKFRFDDWLHHGLMIGIALPIALIYEAHTLAGYSLFFTTGLPGGIDYALLFCVRNGYMNRNTEKKVNEWMNTWIRAPGCISHATATLLYVSMHRAQESLWAIIIMCLPAILVAWNGQYFMRQVIRDAAVQMIE